MKQTVKRTIYLPEKLAEALKEKADGLGITQNAYIVQVMSAQLLFERQILDKITPETLANLLEKMTKK